MLRVWDEVLPTRLNDPKTGIFIVMMQRSHERDLIGHILAKEFNGIHEFLLEHSLSAKGKGYEGTVKTNLAIAH